MGADMLAATLLCKPNADLDFNAGHAAVEALDPKSFEDYALENLVQDWVWGTSEEEGVELDGWDPRPTLHKVVDALKDGIWGREVTVHSFPDVWIFIAGGMSWGDSPEACQPMWTVSEYPEILEAIGFLDPSRLTIKESA